VLQQSFLADDKGLSAVRLVGETVDLHYETAQYLVLAGIVSLSSEMVQAPVPPIQAGDVVILKRDGVDRVLSPSELPAFVAPLLSLQPSAPSVPAPSGQISADFSDPNNSSLAAAI
jgi:hypothetical protein